MNPATSTQAIDQQLLEQLVEQIAQEIFSRLSDRQLAELRGLGIEEIVCPGCDHRCVEACPEKAQRVMDAGAARLSAAPGISQVPSDIAALIDHTLLKPEASRDDIARLCREAMQFGFAAVVVNPYWVPLAVSELHESPVKVCSVVGFPLGATFPQVKMQETEQLVMLGAQEVDMVINVGALKSGQDELVEQDIRGVVVAAHAGRTVCKVILECGVLTDEEVVRGCQLAQTAGADFVKTSTGFGPGGATARHVEMMRLAVGPQMGVKAAGGIRSYDALLAMVEAGATRIGASASVRILREAAEQSSTAAAEMPFAWAEKESQQKRGE